MEPKTDSYMDEIEAIKKAKPELSLQQVLQRQIVAAFRDFARTILEKTGECPACGHRHKKQKSTRFA